MNRFKTFFILYGTHVLLIVFLVAAGAIGFLGQFWLKKEFINGISKSTLNFYAILVGIGTGLFGYLANLLVSRQKEFNLSKFEILDRIQKGFPVAPVHRRKVEELGRESLNIWRQILAVPDEGNKLSDVFFVDRPRLGRQFVSMELGAELFHTSCPKVEEEVILFFNTYQISPGVIDIESVENIEKILSDKLTLLEGNAPQSIALFRVLSHVKFGSDIRIWVKIPNYTISSIHQIDELLNSISGIFRKIFNEFQLTLELYVADDIATGKAVAIIESNKRVIQDSNRLRAYNYTVQRNIAYKLLAERHVFGVADLPMLQIPLSVMNIRLRTLREMAAGDWKSIVVNGSPGSGKTEVVHVFIEEYSQRSNDYFVYCNRTEIHQILQGTDVYQSIDNFLLSLAKFMTELDAATYLPGAKLMSAYNLSAYEDALLDRLRRGLNSVVLIVDDLESYGGLKDTLIQRHDLLNSWGVKLILICRSEILSLKSDFKISLPLWSQREAVSILAEWNSNIDIHDISLQQYISESENSTYLLRIIARRNEFNKSVDVMLREELEDILDPLKRYCTSVTSSAEAQLLEIRNKIQSNASNVDILEMMDSHIAIDIIDLMSKIAWYTKFNIDTLERENGGQMLRSGLIKPTVITRFVRLTTEQASDFIDICIRLRVMSGSPSAAIWVDHLVPDGSIAMRLKQDIIGNSNNNIWEQLIRTLDKSKSLSFLTALMDIPLFDALLEAQNTFGIRKLLTAQVSKFLTQHSRTFDAIASSCLQFTEGLSEAQQEEWIPIVGSLYLNSSYIQQYCHEAITLKRKSGYYLSILFNQLKFYDVWQRYYEIVGSTELAVMALKYAKTEDWVGIVNLLLLEYTSYKDSLLSEWKMFLSRCEVSILPSLIEMILERVFPNDRPSADFGLVGAKLIKEIFEALAEQYQTKPRLYNDLAASLIGILNKKVQALIKIHPSFQAEFDIMVKWLSFYYNRDLTNLLAVYRLKKIGDVYYAIPDRCQVLRNNFAAIRNNIFNGFPRFRLPRVADLSPETPLSNELVADGFPPDYDYAPQYALALYAWKKHVRDGATQSLTENERQNNYLLYWRAIVSLKGA